MDNFQLRLKSEKRFYEENTKRKCLLRNDGIVTEACVASFVKRKLKIMRPFTRINVIERLVKMLCDYL